MTFARFAAVLSVVICSIAGVHRAPAAIKLSTGDASPEAAKLYEYLQEITGKHTLSGQHCVPLVGSTRLPAVHKMLGVYPAVFSQDFGFSEPGSWDGINFRQQIVDESIRRAGEGFVIQLMWHAVRPSDDEPVVFEKSVQGKLSDAEWDELLTPGTRLNERWQSQVDVIAFFLKQLRDAHVPVMWRPYHEMNGKWFWWGGRPGPTGYVKLYRMLHDRLVTFHGLNNLLWTYGANELSNNVGSYAEFFPGHDVVDVLATDVYRQGFAQNDYDSLLALAEGKPIGLGEVGPVPPVDILRAQPRWTYFVVWSDLGGSRTEREVIRTTYRSEETLNWDELPWVTTKKPTLHHPVLR